jgi:phosphate transport system substrate-binding protein
MFAQGLAPVCLNGLWGYIDTNGKYVFEPQFDYAESFYYHKYPTVRVGNYYGAVNSDGEYAVLPWLESIGDFWYGYAAAKHDGLWGIIDEEGFWAVDPIYAVIGDYNAVCAVVSMDEKASLWDVYNVAPGAGLVSLPGGEILLELGHDDISIAYDDGTINAVKDGVKHIYKLNNGKLGEVTVVDSSLDLRVYMPNEGEKVAFLEDGADIKWDEDAPLPRLVGATALLPVYAAFAQATYPDTLRYSGLDVTTADDFELSEDSIGHVSDILFTCTKTAEAYDRLIDGETDIIFCAGPSEKEALLARLKGEELELTLMGYEAFVFIVNADNPISDITVEQIKKIYSGEITSWADLGYSELGEIIAYQRPENSGSQTALEKLMGDTPLMEAPEYVVDSMTMIVDNIEYRNLENSIGYSFRFFVSGMMGSDVKLLQIDGVAPTEENIRNSSYPLITPIYAVTRKGDANPNVRILLDWITDPQGQELVEKSGYVGLGN